ncbi:IS701 family transposase [Actinoplanes sp. NPDC020271]|uniref:IS701 family transposase n=1 Tax=Actinoplanes sp. NPDC020271 TaxID=3363896 RepID=UPI0037B92BF8
MAVSAATPTSDPIESPPSQVDCLLCSYAWLQPAFGRYLYSMLIEPGLGAGKVLTRWNVQVDTTKAGRDDKGQPRTPRKVDAEELQKALSITVRKAGIAGIRVHNRLFVDGVRPDVVDGLLPDREQPPSPVVARHEIRHAILHATEAARTYLCIELPAWNGELLVTVYVRAVEYGDDLYVEFYAYVLLPLHPVIASAEKLPVSPYGRAVHVARWTGPIGLRLLRDAPRTLIMSARWRWFLARRPARQRRLIRKSAYFDYGASRGIRAAVAAQHRDRRFATKPQLALTMIERALDAGMPAGWVTADEAYGGDSKFRIALQRRRVGYVVAVACRQKIPTEPGSARADTLTAAAPVLAWKRRSCGPGAKGERLYDWAAATLPDTGTADHGYQRWLLVRRSIVKPAELAYYLCYGPADTTDEHLIKIAGSRWAIEECFQTAKGQVGLDEYQARRYNAWYRHITLAMLAHAFLAVTATTAGKDDRPKTGSSPSPSTKPAVCWHT